MLKYMLRRILQMIPVLIIITIITFLFVNASGDPTAMLLPPEAMPSDQPIPTAVYWQSHRFLPPLPQGV